MWSRLLHKILFIFLFVIPAYAYAGISITEIMYDPSGGDEGREWIELYNDGVATDIAKWKLFEGGTNHGLSVHLGGSVMQPNTYAVVADNPQKFLTDWPDFSGQLFDIAFSGGLNNTNGETLILRNDALIDIDTVTYSPSIGASGDGTSLQKVGSSFVAAFPTPGAGPTTSNPPPNTPSGEADTGGSANNETISKVSYPVEPQMKVTAGPARTVIAGASTIFEAHVTGLKGENIDTARIVWSFGNGERKEGNSVLYAFSYPGKYVVVVDASSSYFSATTRIVVTVVPADIQISQVTDEFIEISNRSSLELDLGLWQLSADGKVFQFPAHTIIFPKEKVTISNIATGLSPSSPSAVSLLFPNGMVAVKYGQELIRSRTPIEDGNSKSVLQVSNTRVTSSKKTNPNLAAPAAAGTSTPLVPIVDGTLPWIIGLGAVIIVGIVGVLLLPSKKGSTTGYQIIEDDS